MRPLILGIGVPKGGSTWLAAVLGSHPRVVESWPTKEVRFFDLHFNRGESWYAKQFPNSSTEGTFLLDFSPQYLYSDLARQRAASTGYVRHAVAVLRAPWERAWSEYLHIPRLTGDRRQFWSVVADHPEILDRGYYASHLAKWVSTFGAGRLHVCILEELVADPHRCIPELLADLGLDAYGWTLPASVKRNRAFVPRSRLLYAAAMTIQRRVRVLGWQAPLAAARRMGVGRMLRSDVRPPAMNDNVRGELLGVYSMSVTNLEDLLGRRVPW